MIWLTFFSWRISITLTIFTLIAQDEHAISGQFMSVLQPYFCIQRLGLHQNPMCTIALSSIWTDLMLSQSQSRGCYMEYWQKLCNLNPKPLLWLLGFNVLSNQIRVLHAIIHENLLISLVHCCLFWCITQFKNFAQRVEEVDVDVFRSLAPVKFQPTAGSSFFHENLVQWRVRLLLFLLCSQQDLVNVSYGSDVSSRCCVALPTFRWECFPWCTRSCLNG